MVHAKALSKTYSSGKVLHNVSITLKAGTVSGLLGKNGAGKTTLFKILCGLVTPDAGEVVLKSKKAKPIGAVIERPGLYTYLNAYDNLKVFARIQHAPHDEQALQRYLENVGLPLDRKDPVKNFSMGMKQRLGIAIALLNDPDILILDEPFSGLDPFGVSALIKLIKNFAAQGMTILVSSHLMAELQKSCDYLYVIDRGAVVNQGTTSDLIERLVNSYTIAAAHICNAAALQPYLVACEEHAATVQCKSTEIPLLLHKLLSEGYKITRCVPNITLEQLLQVSAV